MAYARRRTRRGALVVSAVVGLLAAWAGPAAGTVVERGHYADTDAFSFVDCGGVTFDVAETFSGQFILKATKDPEAFLLRDTFQFRDVITNRATGKWFVLRGIVNFHEIAYRHISGTIYEFTANETGQPFVIEDSSGRVVVRTGQHPAHRALRHARRRPARRCLHRGDAYVRPRAASRVRRPESVLRRRAPTYDVTSRRNRLPSSRRESGSPSGRARRRLPSRLRRR